MSRRSLRHFTNETIPHEELMSLFEAARWAPSSFNAQPWNFVYARRETKHWGKFFDLLLPSNQVWVKDAAAIGIVISSKYSVHHNKTSFNPTHEYDTGSAWMSLAIEGSARGLAVCGIGGFDYDRAAQVFNIKNETHKICAMFCVGKRDDQSTNETLSQREKIDKFVFEGDFVIF